MEAYLDNSSTTRVYARVCDKMMKVMEEEYGNPSSLHMKGFRAEQCVKEAREEIARSLRVSEKEIIFTSGGTESNNMALIGAAMANKRKGMHLITTAFEHASVGNTMRFLEEQGFRVTICIRRRCRNYLTICIQQAIVSIGNRCTILCQSETEINIVNSFLLFCS